MRLYQRRASSVVSDSATPGTVARRLFRLQDCPSKNTGVGCHVVLQGIFPTQRSNAKQGDSLLFEAHDKLCAGNLVLKVRTRQKGVLRSVTLTHCRLLPILPLLPSRFHPPCVSSQCAWFLVYPSVFFCTNELGIHVCLLSFLFLFVGLPMYSEYLVLQ